MPMPRAKSPPVMPLLTASPADWAMDAGEGWGLTPKRVMNPSCSEWSPAAMAKAPRPARVIDRPRRQAANQMTAPAKPVTKTWGSSAAGRTNASCRWNQTWWARASHSVPSTAPVVAPLTRTR